MRFLYFVVAFAFLSSCAVFDELLEPSDINFIIVPSIDILSHTNNEMVGQGYSLSGTTVSLSSAITTIRVIVDGILTQETVPIGKNWSITVSVSNGMHVNDVYAIDAKGKISLKTTVTLDQHTIPMYNIKLNDNQILVIFNFDGTYEPISMGVVPFILGDNIADFISGASNQEYCTNGGINIDGTGPQILKKDIVTGDYYIILTLPNSSAGFISCLPCNFSPSGWNEVLSSFWIIGKLNSTGFQEKIMYNNYRITSVYSATLKTINSFEMKTNGVFISPDKKRVKFYVGEQSGWSIHLPGGIIDPLQVLLLFTNVPSSIIDPQRTYLIWYPYQGIASNLYTNFIYADSVPVITGDKAQVFTNGTWNPLTGIKITNMNESNHTMQLLLTMLPGTPRTIMFKFVNKLGWNCGEQTWDSFLGLPTLNPGYVLTNIYNYE